MKSIVRALVAALTTIPRFAAPPMLLFMVLSVIVAPATLFAQAVPVTNLEKRFSVAEYRAHLAFLADDLLEGRAPGTRGGKLAARYIAAQFEAAGLEPISREKGYYQPVPMLGNLTDPATVQLTLSHGNQHVALKSLDETVVVSEVEAPEVHVEDELLFVGYGIEAPEFDWNDYRGVDVRGRVLVMLVNDPDLKKTGFGSESLTYYGRWTYKLEIARLKGARGVILLHTNKTATYGFDVVKSSWAVERVSLAGEIVNPLEVTGWISRPAADRALELVGLDFDKLKSRADDRAFQPFGLGLRIDVRFQQRFRAFSSPNVIGRIPGTTRADEAVIYMGHHDHLGVGPAVDHDTIYNGAIDNASGIAALISLARAYSAAPHPLARTVIFLATTGEEKGLLGSEYYTVHPVVPLEKTVLVLNKDCCNFWGRRAGFGAFPLRYTDGALVFRKLGQDLGLGLSVGKVDRGGGAFRMDSFPFTARGVVGLSVGLNGRNLSYSAEEFQALRRRVGRWYHQPNDEIQPYWNYEGIQQELAVLYHVGRHFADGAPPPKLNAEHPFGPAIRLREQKYTRGQSK